MTRHEILFNKSFNDCFTNQTNNPSYYFFNDFFKEYGININEGNYLFDYYLDDATYVVDNTIYFDKDNSFIILKLKFVNLLNTDNSYKLQIIPKSEISCITINTSNLNNYLPEIVEATISVKNGEDIIISSNDCANNMSNKSNKNIIKFFNNLL